MGAAMRPHDLARRLSCATLMGSLNSIDVGDGHGEAA